MFLQRKDVRGVPALTKRAEKLVTMDKEKAGVPNISASVFNGNLSFLDETKSGFHEIQTSVKICMAEGCFRIPKEIQIHSHFKNGFQKTLR